MESKNNSSFLITNSKLLKPLPKLAKHNFKINYATGNFSIAVKDYAQREILSDFVIEREYNSHSATWKFNIKGRPKKITLNTLQEIFLLYEGVNLISITDVLGRVTKFDYVNELLTQVTYPDGGKTYYLYDDNKHLISCEERGKNIFHAIYDDAGRLRQITTSGGRRNFFYDDQNFETVENGGQVTIYKRNRQKLITKIIYADGTEENFSYDAADNLIFKQLRTGEKFLYEYAGILLTKEILPSGLEKFFEYDRRGNLIKFFDSEGHEEFYNYNKKNLLIAKETILNRKASRKEFFERDFTGRILQHNINGRITNFSYDETSPVPSLEETPCGYKFSYRYDDVYRLLAIKTEVGEFNFSYTQLNEVTGNQNIFLPIKKPEISTADVNIFDKGGRLIESREKVGDKFKLMRYIYDNNDNCIERSEWKDLQDDKSATGKVYKKIFDYDKQNRLTVEVDNEKFTEYSYDCLNRCTRQKFQRRGERAKIKNFSYNLNGDLISVNEYEVR